MNVDVVQVCIELQCFRAAVKSEVAGCCRLTSADRKLIHFDDWFELYNAGDTTVDLGGFFLTDSPGNAGQYYLVPDNGYYVIQPHRFLLVWAILVMTDAARNPCKRLRDHYCKQDARSMPCGPNTSPAATD